MTRRALDSSARAKEISALCARQRHDLSFTMKRLADVASVSVRMIVRLENPNQLAQAIDRAGISSRQRLELARVLAQVAVALKVDPADWIAKAGLKFAERELDEVLQRAQRRAIQPVEGPLKELREHSSLSCAVIPYGGFADEDKHPKLTFLGILISMVAASISPDAEVSFEWITNFGEAINHDSRSAVVGYLAQLRREYGNGNWEFAVVPGFRIRLSFLIHADHAKDIGLDQDGTPDWRPLLGDRKIAGPKTVRIVTLKGSVADNTLSGVWRVGRAPKAIISDSFESDYEPKKIAPEVEKHFVAASRAGEICIFCVDQVTADSVREMLPDLPLVDLVNECRDRGCVPAYPLGIGVRRTAVEPLVGVFKRVLDEELFESNAAAVADLYASYLVGKLHDKRELLNSLRSWLVSVEDVEQLKRAVAPTLPTYMRIVPECLHWKLPASFTQELSLGLCERLREDFPDTSSEQRSILANLFFEERGDRGDAGGST